MFSKIGLGRFIPIALTVVSIAVAFVCIRAVDDMIDANAWVAGDDGFERSGNSNQRGWLMPPLVVYRSDQLTLDF